MLPIDVDAILRAEPGEPRHYAYEKDRYALSLLALVIGGARPIAELRRGPYARLLEKSSVRPALARASNGVLTPACLAHVEPERPKDFRVTLTRWGGARPSEWRSSWYQTSRPGQNLVVQLDFPASHDRAYRRLIGPENDHPFVYDFHPARATEPFTLAWARVDLDPESDECLIEEVQCDWIRLARDLLQFANKWLSEGEPQHHRVIRDLRATAPELISYVERVLRPYASIWQECVLMATLELVYRELGVRTVYFHTYEGGLIMKRLGGRSQPPRSLYTELPERFCFRKTGRAPRVFRRDPRLRTSSVNWFVLHLV
jgi:hypothetical protein